MRVLRSTSPQSIKAFLLPFCWGEACKELTWPPAILTWRGCPWKPWILGHTDENATLHMGLVVPAVPHACPQIRLAGSLFCPHYSGIGESGIPNVALVEWEECKDPLDFCQSLLVLTVTEGSEGSLDFGLVWINLHARALLMQHPMLGNHTLVVLHGISAPFI